MTCTCRYCTEPRTNAAAHGYNLYDLGCRCELCTSEAKWVEKFLEATAGKEWK